MKILRTGIAALLLMSTVYVQAQSADDIVSKHIAAIGGKAVISQIKSQVVESEISVMGSTLTSVTVFVAGTGFKSTANFNGQEIIQCITPKGGWMINPLAGQTDPQPLPEDQVKPAQQALELGGALYNYKEKGSKVELAGNDKVEGVDVVKLKLTDKEGKERFFYIDPATHYLVKQESTINVNGENVTTSSIFSNFKKTDIGYIMPYTTFTNQGFEMTVNINKVEFNKEFDPKIFEMPK